MNGLVSDCHIPPIRRSTAACGTGIRTVYDVDWG